MAVDRCADDNRVPYPLATRDELAALVEEFPEAVAVAGDRFGGVDAAGVRLRREALPEAARRRENAVVDAPSADEALARVLSRDPLRPRTHALAPPAGTRPHQRLVRLTGAFTSSAPACVVGPMPGSDAVDELLGYLRERGYHPEGSRP
ncbi:hypothetical protein [Saccharopolyspora erythraea]|uniref:hypothetical protein n=1 Tax=Saccharopolyspora erythraea TaxID=1836 RepID=UPI0020112004